MIRDVDDHSVTAQTSSDAAKRDKQKSSNFARPILLAVLVLAMAGGTYYFWNVNGKQTASDKKDSKRARTAPVNVAVAKIQDVPIEIRTIGNVLPYSVVNVVPQVGGQLTKVYFTQGQMVKKGDLLFQIDPRAYQAALDQALGMVARDKAQVKTAQANLAKDQANVGQLQANVSRDYSLARLAKTQMSRYDKLVTEGAVSHEQSDQMTTNAATAEAAIDADKKAVDNAKEAVNADKAAIMTAQGTLEADQAMVDSARINLGFTQIRSPINGKTSSLGVYEGNVVAANSATPLCSINQVQPIYVTFTVPEENLDQVRKCMANNTLTVQALIEGKLKEKFVGTVNFLESTVNTASGTVSLRATFANVDSKLFPGQFVDVIVTMPPDGQTTVVPSSAVQTSQTGNSVYVVQPDKTVDFVSVDLKRTYGDLAAIGRGLKPGDVVVIDGQLQLTPGAKVDIQQTHDTTLQADGPKHASPQPEDDQGAAPGAPGK
ncbi:MAG TPA: efflux RND transporter periplasmic adaptor subunit [Drouetiella sp.]